MSSMSGITRILFGKNSPTQSLTDWPPSSFRVFLADDNLSIVLLYQGNLFGGSREGEDHLLNRGGVLVAVEAMRHVPGRGDALEGLDHGLAHVVFDARIGHAQRQRDVAAELKVAPEEVGVSREELSDDLAVGFLPLGVPHLLVASQGEHVDGLVHLAVPLQDPSIVGKRGRRRVVRVLRAHHLGN